MRLLALLWNGFLPPGARCRALAALLWLLGSLHGGVAQACAPLELTPGTAPVNLWKHLCLQADATLARTAQDMLASRTDFAAPPTQGGSLGVRQDAVWLHASLRVQTGSTPPTGNPWVLNIDYPLLHELDVYLAADGQIIEHHALGSLQERSPLALDWRTPALALPLEPGRSYDLLIRVHTLGGMILPMRVGEWQAMVPPALREQTLQGLFAGLAACLLVYGMAQAIVLREQVFAYYVLLVLGSAGFSFQFFGLGSQIVWGGMPWLELHAGTTLAFLSVIGAFLFMGHALVRSTGLFLRIMQGGAAIAGLLCAAFLLDLLSTPAAMTVLTVLGPLPSLISVPMAIRRMREGDPIGRTLILAWAVYVTTAMTLALLVQGVLPATFWPMHTFQFGAVMDMLLFMRMLDLRNTWLRDEVRHTSRERDALHSLAHTDPLTGLPNRRGLDAALGAALPHARADRLLAVYVLDLDGFKPVNDLHGHDVGDRLLVAVAQRLRQRLRAADLVARVGGDEFVVMAHRLPSTMQAHDLGIKLLESFLEPFQIRGQDVHVGLTIGYALAPVDATDAAALIRLADAAMYSGKQQGKFCVRRNTGDLALASS